jgi:hypothetical protein
VEEIAGYRVVRLLGSGASGQVYEAEDPRLGRRVAIKLLHRGSMATDSQLARFRREREALARLQHPHVLAVHAAGSWRGSPYVVTELLPGRTLADVVREGPVPWRAAVDYALQVADGLAALHAADLVHRDVKPANVLLDASGRVKVADLGLAVGADDERLTATGTVVGSPAYMAPEALSGRLVRHPTLDVYSLGALLFELLSGHVPHPAAGIVEMVAARVRDPTPDPRRHAPEVPEAVVAVVQRAMAESPDARYPDGGAMARALREVKGGGGAGLERRVVVAAVFGVFVLALALWAGASPPAESEPPALPPPGPSTPPPAQRLEDPDGGGALEAPLPTRILRDLRLETGTHLGPSPQVGWSAEGLHAYEERPTVLYRYASDVEAPTAPRESPLEGFLEVTCSVWDLERGSLALGGVGGVRLIDLATGEVRRSVSLPAGAPEVVSALAWGSDGALLVGTGAGGLYALATADPQAALVEVGRAEDRIASLAHRGATTYYYWGVPVLAGSDPEAADYRSAQGYGYALGRLPSVEEGRGALLQYKASVLVAPAGTRELLVGTTGHQIFRRPEDSATPSLVYERKGVRKNRGDLLGRLTQMGQQLPCAHNGPVVALALAREGRRLLSLADVGGTGELALWSSADGAFLDHVRVPGGTPTSMAISPAGDRVAVSVRGGGLRVFRLR